MLVLIQATTDTTCDMKDGSHNRNPSLPFDIMKLLAPHLGTITVILLTFLFILGAHSHLSLTVSSQESIRWN